VSLDTLQQLQSGELKGIKRLDLSCGLTEFPSEIFDLADSLEVLNLSGNQLSGLPDDLWRLHKMQIIFCSDNLFTELPAVLGRCSSLTMIGFKANQIRLVPDGSLPKALRWLVLTDNQIAQLPPSIGDCAQLQKLMLAGNQLTALPANLANCQQLELIRLAANRFAALPEVLFELPRLAWLAIGGNPLGAAIERQHLKQQGLPRVAWDDLVVGQLLGEGASGAIYQVQYRAADRVCDAAMKLFKGQVTSDGLPASEMAACCAAGSHPHLIGVLAQLIEHPEHSQGLLVPLIASSFTVLAQPPSLASCTRDVYRADVSFTWPVMLKIARGLAAAALHLHQRGIVHGDLYAHNILHDAAGYVFLGDFGAAAFYQTQCAWASWLEKVEVRAFGCLLAELLERCSSDIDLRVGRLRQLQAQCVQANVAQRPQFAAVLATLDALL